jgi:hypothetical protein
MKKKKTFEEIMTEKLLEEGISQTFIDSNMEFIDDIEPKKTDNEKPV